jgi:hypothetical protein
VQHSIDWYPRIGQNPRFADQLGSSNPDHRVNYLDVLRDREESSQWLEQIEEHVMMVGSWPCKVSCDVHINGRRVSEPVREDKGKATVPESEDEKDPKRARRVLSKGHEVVRLGYSMLPRDPTRVIDRGGESGNPYRVDMGSPGIRHESADRSGYSGQPR